MTVFLHVLLLSAKPVECASQRIKMPGHYVSFSVQYCIFSRDVTSAMLVRGEQKHFSPLETKVHFLNSPNYGNCIGVLKARALNFLVKILDGVDQATIQIRHHRMLSLVPNIFHPIMGE